MCNGTRRKSWRPRRKSWRRRGGIAPGGSGGLHQVFAYTISGKWGYLEHDWVATAGSFVYEAHTLVAYESDEPMPVNFYVTEPLIWLDENGEPESTFDVFDYIELCQAHYEKVRLGTDYVETLSR